LIEICREPSEYFPNKKVQEFFRCLRDFNISVSDLLPTDDETKIYHGLISAIFFIEPKLSKEEGIEAFAAILNAIKFFLVSMGENLKCKKEINKLCEEIKILTCRLSSTRYCYCSGQGR